MKIVLQLVVFAVCLPVAAAADFRVRPYLQNPDTSSITVRWLSDSSAPGLVTLRVDQTERAIASTPVLAVTLSYNPFREEPEAPHPAVPWIHSVRIDGLQPGTAYSYRVQQGTEAIEGLFRTEPAADQPVRLIVYSDPETEPESSTSPPVEWPAGPGSNRPEGITKYLVNQTDGYRANLRVMQERSPDLILLVGDLVETGGEQRDWDEFWRHNAGHYGTIASAVPIVASLGNHENYAGPGGGYTAAGADFATAKFLTYFESPDNGASDPHHKGRYFRIDYGPVTLISLDSSDGLPHKSASDTNHNLEGSHAPDFNPGSEQYQWLERQLQDAQHSSRFTFVQFHHTMFGSGPHSVPFGQESFSGQSGIAMRVLLPLFMKFGVDVVFSGHDEMLERSAVTGTEVGADGRMEPHEIHFYDAGIGGDGLRGPAAGFDNPHRRFLAHDDAPEVWEANRLVSGGKHYGHLEVHVAPDTRGVWQIKLTPIAVFPVMDATGTLTRWERRVYPDEVVLPSR